MWLTVQSSFFFAIVMVNDAQFGMEKVAKQSMDRSWEEFKKLFNKNYTQEEDEMRRVIWKENFDYIIKHNMDSALGKLSYKLGINAIADMTLDEIQKILNGFLQHDEAEHSNNTAYHNKDASHSAEVDWRKEGLVTNVKDQGKCGSCWAFSATGALEGQLKKKTGQLTTLSEQSLIDCSRHEGNHGCDGGFMTSAFLYVQNHHGIDTEASYPYKGKVGSCKAKQSAGVNIKGYANVFPRGSEEALKHAVATVGPISVGINAGRRTFQLYSSGVYDDEHCNSFVTNHGVLLVGYGAENGKDYWLVKNSWSENWGEKGYIKMIRGKKNQCAIATSASYPLL